MHNRLVLAGSCLAVAVSTFFLSDEPGKLTVLSLFIQILPFLPLELLAGPGHAESLYPTVGRLFALALNVLAFAAVAGPMFLVLRRRAPRILTALLTVWLATYFLLLFVLFPVEHLDL